jgi:hypothetical protein
MRQTPWVVGLGVVAWFVTGVLRASLRPTTEERVAASERAILTGRPSPADPWYEERPFVASIGAGLAVLVVGSVIVIALNAERRD